MSAAGVSVTEDQPGSDAPGRGAARRTDGVSAGNDCCGLMRDTVSASSLVSAGRGDVDVLTSCKTLTVTPPIKR